MLVQRRVDPSDVLRITIEGGDIDFAANQYSSTVLKFTTSSMSSPFVQHQLHLPSGTLDSEQSITLDMCNLGKFQVQEIFVAARDGVRIPVTVIYSEKAQLGPSPVVISAYGAYGVISKQSFEPNWVPYLDRGWTIALAHLRGGGERGVAWHSAGKQLRKWNSINDLSDTISHFRTSGVSKIFGIGASAGAVPWCAVLNESPSSTVDALALRTPFLNLIEVLQNRSSALNLQDHSEWGDPAVAQHLDYLASYDPLKNIKQKRYPPILLSAGVNDPRIELQSVLAFREKISEAHPSNQVEVLLSEGGHFDTQSDPLLQAAEVGFFSERCSANEV